MRWPWGAKAKVRRQRRAQVAAAHAQAEQHRSSVGACTYPDCPCPMPCSEWGSPA